MKRPCEYCGGSGQTSYFKGVSRFLLSTEECVECGGLGYLFPANDTDGPDDLDDGGFDRPNKKVEKQR